MKAENYLINPSPAPIYPGLVGTELDTDTGKFITFDAGWEAGVDSFIEVSVNSECRCVHETNLPPVSYQDISVRPFG